jgi:O-antigen ligase
MPRSSDVIQAGQDSIASGVRTRRQLRPSSQRRQPSQGRMTSTGPQLAGPGRRPGLLSGAVTAAAALYLGAVLLCSYSTALGLSWLPQLLGLILFVLFLADYGRWPLAAVRVPLPVALYGAWILLAAATTIWGPTDADGITLRTTLLKVGLITGLLSLIVRTSRQIISIAVACVCAFLIVVVLNHSEIAAVQDAAAAGIVTEADRLAGTMENANVFGIVAVTVCWLAVLLLTTARRRPVRVLVSFVVLLSIMVALWTQSRKAILALPLSVATVSVLLIAARASHPSMRTWVGTHVPLIAAGVVLLGIMVAFILCSPYGTRVRDLLGGRMDQSAGERMTMGQVGLQLWSRHPVFGAGLDQFRAHYGGTYSHSTVIEVLVSTGLMGFVLYFGALAAAAARAFAVARNIVDGEPFRVALVALVFAVLFSFFNLFAVMYDDRLLWPLLGGFCGFVYGQGAGRGQRVPGNTWTHERIRRGPRRVATGSSGEIASTPSASGAG